MIEYDLDGNKQFEDRISLKELALSDQCEIINTAGMQYSDFQKIFIIITEKLWNRAMDAIRISKKYNLNPDWYSFFMNPRNLNEKYNYGFWLNYYIYKDLGYMAKIRKDPGLVQKIDKAYYSGNWKILD